MQDQESCETIKSSHSVSSHPGKQAIECCHIHETISIFSAVIAFFVLVLQGPILYWGILPCREVQGPVTNIVSIDGLLIVAWGSRLESFAWKGQRLETTCFHEASVLITSLSSIKRYLLIGDIHKSVTFLDLVQGNHSFENLSKVGPSSWRLFSLVIQSQCCTVAKSLKNPLKFLNLTPLFMPSILTLSCSNIHYLAVVNSSFSR